MEDKEIIEFIQSILDPSDIETLNFSNKIVNQENRRSSLRSFFHNENIFNKINPVVDPTRLCSEIFIKGAHYEF